MLKHLHKLHSNIIRQTSIRSLTIRSHITPLASAFNRFPRPQKSTNRTSTGLFGIPELRSPNGFLDLRDRAESRVKSLLAEVDSYSANSSRKLVQIIDDISNELCKVADMADMAEFIRTTHPDAAYRHSAEQAHAAISCLVEQLNTNVPLYNKLRGYYEAGANMDECDRRVTRLYLADFEQSGIHLPDETRSLYVQVNNDLLDLLTRFQMATQVPAQARPGKIDKKFAKLFRSDMEISAMYTTASDENLRELVYRAYLQRDVEQEKRFEAILERRHRMSLLCAYDTFSARANATMILEKPDNVMLFLHELASAVQSKAFHDFDEMRRFKRLSSEAPLMQWDVPYITQTIKRHRYDLSHMDYRPYLSIGAVMNGVNLVLNSLFKINLVAEEADDGELWHESVIKLRVQHEQEGLLGYIYCDFYERDDKYAHVDCHYTVQCSKLLDDGTYQLPIVVLHLNLNEPLPNRPSLLSFDSMTNLFHEFGHAIHSMLAKTRYQHVSGTRCSTDFSEVPSQVMEFFCNDPRIITQFAHHYDTNEPLSIDQIHKLCASNKLFTASNLQLQVLHSILDQVFHAKYPLNSAPNDLVRQMTDNFYHLPFVNDTYWHLRFSHFVGYAAKYYAYLISKAIATKIWSECFAKDPLSSSAGENYREKLLAHGGERHPTELVNSLIGFDVNIKSIVSSLVESL